MRKNAKKNLVQSQGGGSGVLSAPCDQDATLMVQNLYSERELSIKLLLGEGNPSFFFAPSPNTCAAIQPR